MVPVRCKRCRGSGTIWNKKEKKWEMCPVCNGEGWKDMSDIDDIELYAISEALDADFDDSDLWNLYF
jgi:RecJ-like exonuclease